MKEQSFCEGLEHEGGHFQQCCALRALLVLVFITLLFKINGGCMYLVNEHIGSFPKFPSIYFSPKKKLMRSAEIVHRK